MDFGTIIIATISILVCALPFAFIALNRRKNEKKLISELAALSEGDSFNLTKYQAMVDMIIGADEISNKLYFHRKSKNGIQNLKIDLNEYSGSELIKTNRIVGENNNSSSLVDSISIQLKAANHGAKNLKLEIYNSNDSIGLSDELNLASEWVSYLNNRLKNQH